MKRKLDWKWKSRCVCEGSLGDVVYARIKTRRARDGMTHLNLYHGNGGWMANASGMGKGFTQAVDTLQMLGNTNYDA